AADDLDGNIDIGYTGTVHFSSSDSAGVLPDDYTFATSDAGVHHFSVMLKTAGNKSITGTDIANPGFAGSTTIAVAPAARAKLAFSQQPGNTPAASAMTPAVTLQVHDKFGNRVTTPNTTQLPLPILSNPDPRTF